MVGVDDGLEPLSSQLAFNGMAENIPNASGFVAHDVVAVPAKRERSTVQLTFEYPRRPDVTRPTDRALLQG